MLNKQKNQKSINNQTSKINNKTNNPKSSRINKLSENKKEKNEKKDFLKPTTKNQNIINVKNEMKIKNSKSIIKQTLKPKTNNKKNNNNNQNIYSSNFILPTNDTEIKEEEKIKKTFYETENSKNEEMNLYYLGNLFRTSNLKRTIIIDGNGNNNLNMNKNILNLDNKENNIKRSSLPLKNYEPFSHKKLESENLCLINKFENKNKLIDEKDELRLKEYGIIFNLINDNIEEMKNMFKNNSQKEIKDDKKLNKKEIRNEHKSKTKKIIKTNFNNIIFNEKEREEINKIGNKHEISYDIIQGKSFLESCFQDDFCTSLINNDQNNNNNNFSFEFSSILTNNSNNDKTRNNIINFNDDLEKTECEIDNLDDENYINQLKNNTYHPRFLVDKKCNNFSKTKTDKCTIF
jgi:hypothetical protein